MSIIRDAREVFSAAAVSLAFFGVPAAMLGVQYVPELPQIVAAPERAAIFQLPMTGSPDGESESAPPPAPAPEAVSEVGALDAPGGYPISKPTVDAVERSTAARASQMLPQAVRGDLDRSGLSGVVYGKRRSAAKGEESVKQSKEKKCETADPRIQSVGDDRFEIERALIDGYASDLNAASDLASVSWHRDASGEIDGFRVKRIRCGSVLHAAGLRNGDVIHSVNGKDITSIARALGAWRKVRRKDSVKLALTRKGERRKVRYSLT